METDDICGKICCSGLPCHCQVVNNFVNPCSPQQCNPPKQVHCRVSPVDSKLTPQVNHLKTPFHVLVARYMGLETVHVGAGTHQGKADGHYCRMSSYCKTCLVCIIYRVQYTPFHIISILWLPVVCNIR